MKAQRSLALLFARRRHRSAEGGPIGVHVIAPSAGNAGGDLVAGSLIRVQARATGWRLVAWLPETSIDCGLRPRADWHALALPTGSGPNLAQ
jgi:hypothetical protein